MEIDYLADLLVEELPKEPKITFARQKHTESLKGVKSDRGIIRSRHKARSPPPKSNLALD